MFAGLIILAIISCKPDSKSNTFLAQAAITASNQPSTFFNSVERASFKYTQSTLFKTGKVSAPRLTLAADSTIHYRGKKYLTKLKYYDVQKKLFGFGSLATSNTTVLLFTKDNQFHTLEVKGVGGYEFMGVKDDRYYFRFTQQDATTCFSLSLYQPEVKITEYTVESE
ncbi:hypothetical protein A4D02_10130 [Niastella koreensis]|nr:hypothetical protein [Niastella koreensis]OQP43827.1 hypothetical protein A4D02_10130 [Niastella koreensis]